MYNAIHRSYSKISADISDKCLTALMNRNKKRKKKKPKKKEYETRIDEQIRESDANRSRSRKMLELLVDQRQWIRYGAQEDRLFDLSILLNERSDADNLSG